MTQVSVPRVGTLRRPEYRCSDQHGEDGGGEREGVEDEGLALGEAHGNSREALAGAASAALARYRDGSWPGSHRFVQRQVLAGDGDRIVRMLGARWWPGAGSNRRPSDFQSDARTN